MKEVTCRFCTRKFAVSDDVVRGQHVRCPYCERKFSYLVDEPPPQRVEVPVGDQVRRGEDAKADVSQSETRKATELHLIRKKPNGESGASDPYAKRKVTQTEENARFYEELKTLRVRRTAWKNIVSIVALLGLVVTGTFVFFYFRHQQIVTKHAELELQLKKAEKQLKLDEINRQKRMREEEEARQSRQKDEEEAKSRRLKAEEEEKKRDEQAKREKERIEQEVRRTREFYFEMMSSFEDGNMNFLPQKETKDFPISRDGTYAYLLPFNGEKMPLLTICEMTNGTCSAYRVSEEGEKFKENGQQLLASIASRDYLVSNGRQVWFHSKRAKPHVGTLPKDKVVDLGAELFGDLAPEIKKLELSFTDLEFEIVLVPKEKKKGKQQIIVTQVVDYGAAYSLEAVRDAVGEYFEKSGKNYEISSGTISSSRRKKFKRTVCFWDGALVKQGIDGVTYVPRTPPSSAYHKVSTPNVIIGGRGYNNYYSHWRHESRRAARAACNMDRWNALAKRAEEEDRQEREFYENLRKQKLEEEALREKARQSKFERKVSEIVDQGSLFWRARLKSKQK